MIKGTAKIELTNVKTGKKEIYQHDNLITNAVNDVLGLNPLGFKSMLADNSILFPVVPKLIGGVLLCENPLEEDPSKYWVPNGNPIVGYSGYNVNTNSDPKRGSLNQVESGKLEDGSGYRFVFDFATSQGNGVISALGLTSGTGGSNGYGNAVELENGMKSYLSNTDGSDSSAYSFGEFIDRGVHLSDIVMLLPDKNEAVAIWKTAANTFMLRKTKLALSSVGLFDDPNVLPYENEYTDIPLFTSTFGKTDSSYFTFVGGEDGCIWGFEHSGGADGNAADSASVNWVKINVTDFTVEEGTWTLDAQLWRFGINAPSDGYQPQRVTSCIIHDGFLYCVNYTRTGIYRIQLSNITNITFMQHPDGNIHVHPYSGRSTDNCGTVFNIMYDTVYFANGYIQGDEIVSTACQTTNSSSSGSQFVHYHPFGLRKTGKPGLRVGPFLFLAGYWRQLTGDDAVNAFSVVLLSNYLATINNLMEPVEKTAEKTMKITYILRMIPEVIPEEETE